MWGNRLFRLCSVTQPLGCFRFHFPSPHIPSRCTSLPPTPRIILVSLLLVITFFAALWPLVFVDVGHVLTSDTAATSLKRSRFEDPTKPTFHLAPLIYCQSLRFSFIPSSSSLNVSPTFATTHKVPTPASAFRCTHRWICRKEDIVVRHKGPSPLFLIRVG